MQPSQQVTEICDILGLGCRPNTDVSQADWQRWLDGFQGIPFKKECPVCGKVMVERNGKHGRFWGCKGYPKCKHTENIA